MIAFSTAWFVKGLSHPAMTPSHIILILALGLLIGQQVNTGFLSRILVLMVSLIAGFIMNHYLGNTILNSLNTELILLLVALIIGLLTLLKLELPGVVLLLFSLITGIILGLDSTPAIIPGLSSVSTNSWLFGAACGVIGMLGIIALISLLLRKVLNGLMLRILASWIATSAIFVLTLMLAK